MTSVSRVPGPQEPAGEELSVEQAGRAVRRVGILELTRQAFTRFRYGDGFSHSRALALQLCLSIVPLASAASSVARRWAQLTSMSIFLGMAFTAQIEAAQASLGRPALPDPEPADTGTSGTLAAIGGAARAVLHRITAAARRGRRRRRR